MKRTIRIPLVFVILLVLVVIVCIKSNASTTGVITEITVNVREKDSIDSDIIMFVTQDDKVEVLEKIGDWYKIKYKGKEGYVYSDFIKVDSDSKAASSEEEQKKLESDDDEVTKTITPKLLLSKDTGLRISPNVMSNIIYTTVSDEDIDLLEQINGWSYVSVNNIRGWIRNDQIKEVTTEIEENKEEVSSTSTVEDKLAYVKYDNVNLRKEPSADSTILQRLKLNTQVLIIEEVDSIWSKVIIGGETGYISKDLLSEKKQEEKKEEETDSTATSRDGETLERITTQATDTTSNTKKEVTTANNEKKSQTSSNKANEIVAYAKKYLGYDYVYGGSSPKTGFDCSGFTFYVYKHFGYNISRSSVGQASNGIKVNKEDLMPGDLVIYKNTSLTSIGHVGIYIGDNKMIHASEPGVGVTITDIDSKAHKYPQRFVMGRRIIK